MRGSLNLILESHQPQTRECGIYHTYEKNLDTSPCFVFSAEETRVGRTESTVSRQRNEQGMKPKKGRERRGKGGKRGGRGQWGQRQRERGGDRERKEDLSRQTIRREQGSGDGDQGN